MITEEEITLNIVECYDEYYGLSYNQEILTQIALEQKLFKGRNAETILQIFLLEQFDNPECYLDVKHEFVNYDYLKEHPQEIEDLIVINYKQYEERDD